MNENKVNGELLESVAGGGDVWEDMAALVKAMDKVNGKKCKYCNQVYSKQEMISGRHGSLSLFAYEFVTYNKEKVPCTGCCNWRNIDTDFVD